MYVHFFTKFIPPKQDVIFSNAENCIVCVASYTESHCKCHSCDQSIHLIVPNTGATKRGFFMTGEF